MYLFIAGATNLALKKNINHNLYQHTIDFEKFITLKFVRNLNQTANKCYHLFKRFYEVLAYRIILWVYKEVYKNHTKTTYKIILHLNI